MKKLYNDAPFINKKKAVSNEELATQLAQTLTETKKHFLQPRYVEYFGSFNRFGRGTPEGIANYTGGKYVLTISGNVGDSFVTVESGNIAHAGLTSRWACVIENNDSIFDVNQVTGTDGITTVNLLEPLKASITSKRLGNLHDLDVGQHYTELGYYAFAQHIYRMNPRYTERSNFFAQFKPTDLSGSWISNAAWTGYNNAVNMESPNKYFTKIGSYSFHTSAADNTQYVEWEQKVSGEKGYFESYIGIDRGSVLVEFFKDGVLSGQTTVILTAKRIIFDYEGVDKAKVRITAQGPFDGAGGRQTIYIGLTTWWKNEKFLDNQLIDPNDKIVYIGDSWGVFHNKATTRELTRLMQADGGTPTVLDYSLGGHTSEYAMVWFDDYIIANKPDAVIIEFFTNDFNSIGGTNVGTFTNPDGQQQDMNIENLQEYINNFTYMIDKAIENGIQPIVLMPASTNSGSQTQSFADKSVQLWLGKASSNEYPLFKTATAEKVTTQLVESTGTTAVGSNVVKLLSKEVSSGARKGVLSDTGTGASITNGDIHGFYNNGSRKAGINFNGTLDVRDLKFNYVDTFSLPTPSANYRGSFVFRNGSTDDDDEIYVCVQKLDSTFAWKKVTLV